MSEVFLTGPIQEDHQFITVYNRTYTGRPSVHHGSIWRLWIETLHCPEVAVGERNNRVPGELKHSRFLYSE
ncbi:hypothetical protein RRG08_001209 [Elysia crispata]|uniref:Uncharacterized protein n=1 Tax=Elysia crispata TaxID=231223 RepID=A0AAE1B8X1_9GAST|nr:hypothetical protein RRG08_001209 [Elysia crispata]